MQGSTPGSQSPQESNDNVDSYSDDSGSDQNYTDSDNYTDNEISHRHRENRSHMDILQQMPPNIQSVSESDIRLQQQQQQHQQPLPHQHPQQLQQRSSRQASEWYDPQQQRQIPYQRQHSSQQPSGVDRFYSSGLQDASENAHYSHWTSLQHPYKHVPENMLSQPVAGSSVNPTERRLQQEAGQVDYRYPQRDAERYYYDENPVKYRSWTSYHQRDPSYGRWSASSQEPGDFALQPAVYGADALPQLPLRQQQEQPMHRQPLPFSRQSLMQSSAATLAPMVSHLVPPSSSSALHKRETINKFPSLVRNIMIPPDGPGQRIPPDISQTPGRVSTALWEEEGTICLVVELRGMAVTRRCDNNMINGTKLLNSTKITRGRRDGVLKGERVRHVVKIGGMDFKGVWIPFERALEMARRENVLDMLYPLFVADLSPILYSQQNYSRLRQLLAKGAMRNPKFNEWIHGIPRITGPNMPPLPEAYISQTSAHAAQGSQSAYDFAHSLPHTQHSSSELSKPNLRSRYRRHSRSHSIKHEQAEGLTQQSSLEQYSLSLRQARDMRRHRRGKSQHGGSKNYHFPMHMNPNVSSISSESVSGSTGIMGSTMGNVDDHHQESSQASQVRAQEDDLDQSKTSDRGLKDDLHHQ